MASPATDLTPVVIILCLKQDYRTLRSHGDHGNQGGRRAQIDDDVIALHLSLCSDAVGNGKGAAHCMTFNTPIDRHEHVSQSTTSSRQCEAVMSTGSASDAEDTQEISCQPLEVHRGRSMRDTTPNVHLNSGENSEDEFSADDGFEGKSKRLRTDSHNRHQLKSHKDGRQSQRNAANARERARMRVLSKAFSRLKTSLPWVPADTKLSKLDTLRLASSYISHLRQLLQDDRLENNFVHPVNLTWPFVVSGRAEDPKEIAAAARLCGATA
ncbi:transcription factor 21 [Chanos chanos]|uniref:Transcription factor 21 n=1 Tax=Chanos chanos TaxID=29144 RepID=A0A6J2USH3_CHACN|nr:musculin [Chanos chanos]